MIYFDNAATTGKKPELVVKAVNNAMHKLSANPGRSGHSLSVNAAVAMYKTREKIAEFFGADSGEQVIFTPNCTYALNAVIKGIVKHNDKVVASDMEHNSVIRPLNKSGADIRYATVSLTQPEKTVKSFEGLITDNTQLVICTAASNVTGTLLPLYQIGELCKRHNVPFAVDAAQAAGVIDIDMQKMNIDFLCIAPHKGFYAPMGTGILIARKPLYNTVTEGGTGTDSVSTVQPLTFPEGFESGTVNLPGIMGISAGIDFVKRIGVKKIHSHESSLVRLMYERLSRTDHVTLYTPHPDKLYCAPVLSFNIKEHNSNQISSLLSDKGFALRSGLHCAPSAHKKLHTEEIGTVRFSPSIFNNAYEVKQLCDNISYIAKKL